MKNIFKLLLFYLLIFIIFSLLYFISFHTQIFNSQKIIFYRGLKLLLITLIPTIFIGVLLIKLLNIKNESLFAAIVFTLSIHVCLFVLLPVTLDRSVTTYILEVLDKKSINNVGCFGLNEKVIEKDLINTYIKNNNALDKRILEQQEINFIKKKDKCIELTPKAKLFLKFSEIIKKIYKIK